MKRIVLIGPESTGKSTLTQQLAKHYQADYIPEFARAYTEQLNRPYTYADVEYIANAQRQEFINYQNTEKSFVFVDTDLIITKVWMDLVYGSHPAWIDLEIHRTLPDLYLLCDTDLPWEPDRVRENGGEMRQRLFDIYQQQIISFKANYVIINGIGNNRLLSAIAQIDKEIGVLRTF